MSNLIGDTSDPDTAGVLGVSHTTASGVIGVNDSGPGQPGNGGAFISAEGEGVRGTCNNGNNVGVFGRSTAGGIGVFGESLFGRGTRGGTGVVGQSRDGTGVFGISENQRGVEGHGTKDHGVVGQSTDGTGVFGISENQRGVEGHGTKDHGVVGQSRDGAGVFGISTAGIGVRGKGGQLAGLFEGDVKIEGRVLAPGGDLEQRIAQLERQGRTNFGAPITIPVTRPNLAVRQLPGEPLPFAFEVKGSAFLRGTTVFIRVFNSTRLNDDTHSVISDQNGTISLSGAQIQILCQPGDRLQVAASDSRSDLNDQTSVLWTNSVSIVVS